MHRYYLFSPLSFLNEVYLQGRSIDHEHPHIGSPPLPETNTRILGFDKVEERQAPKHDGDGYSYMSFFIRLSPSLSMEETSYWVPSILDLFAMWGALFSFLSTLSIGLVATTYNQKRGYRSFKRRGGSDIRLYDKQDFDRHGRLACLAEERKIPTTLFGELRAYAEIEQKKKKKASVLLCRTMVKRFHASRNDSLTPTICSNDQMYLKQTTLESFFTKKNYRVGQSIDIPDCQL
mmetsp:Transcript_25223/g.37251  ORF Transcript_25223/g.37251 Transcript_25223/m.37251 type:complete len:234 (+) Transcript_25223:756-1457(+)|eukprot:CAMPEP_0194227890 /NCGR_PEP_ID=MMETSP0156-20130528/43091_1 /TAXON_ID=33649 /ORGANISM="Thalassionema nitzschioides, Strain L26-B" /LENGTH=233 /DNA_ID=CAMNT_0038960387 /DNA_START=673 /DNA_END=1374 /DNA_ORIENTATION=-